MSSTVTIFVLVMLVLTMAAVIVRETRARNALQRWLGDNQQAKLLDGHGRWQHIFAALERLEKLHRERLSDKDQVIDRYRLAIEVMPDGVLILDHSDHIEWLNAAAAEHLTIDSRRDRGTLIGQLFRQPVFQEYLGQYRSNPYAANLKGITLTSPDSQRTLDVHLFPLPTNGSLLLTCDISESVRIDSMRRDFVANVSHELRTPATVIYGFLEQLAGDPPPRAEDAKRFLDLMLSQVQRMTRLVDDLLVLSRLENSPRPPEDDSIKLDEFLAVAIDEARILSNGRHEVQLESAPEIYIRASSSELRSAVGNLLSNAIRYTADGGVVTLHAAVVTDCVEICVKDNGIGITEEHIPRLTERFYRVDRGRSSATGGTGLGLAIVKHVLNRHQAQLKITSTFGSGSRFCIRLPRKRLLTQA